MPSFAHKKLIERVARIDGAPDDAAAYGTWIEAGEHLTLLRDNAAEDELIVYASGHYTFIHAAVVSNDKLAPVDQADLVYWSGNPFSSVASYVSGSRQDGIWIERDVHHSGAKTLEGAKQLVFGRTFEGFTGSGRAYFEVLQEYAHLLQIHWRPEQRAYCRFDEHGDLDHVVSITLKNEDERGVTLASFKHGPLEEYLAVSNCALVRMFDFTLLRHAGFSGWPDGSEGVFNEGDDLFYRQKIAAGQAAYTRGVQIIRSTRPKGAIFLGNGGALVWTAREAVRRIHRAGLAQQPHHYDLNGPGGDDELL